MSNAPRRDLREQQSDAVRERLLDAAMTLVERGVEPTMRAVAREGGTSERTIYRYFESHDVLVTALAPRFATRAGVPLCSDADGLPAYVEALFGTFEANRQLVLALVSSTWAAPRMAGTRKKNLDDLRALLDRAHPRAPAAERASAAASLRAVLSGSGWAYLRVSAGVPQAEVVAHAQWLVGTVRRALELAERRARR